MDEKINTFNVEAGVFLHHLRSFNGIKNVKVGNKSLMLLTEIVSIIDELVANAPECTVANEVDPNFLQDLNQEQYELRRSIMCRLSSEAFPIFFVDFQKHLNKVSHFQLARKPPPASPKLIRLSDLSSSSEANTPKNSTNANVPKIDGTATEKLTQNGDLGNDLDLKPQRKPIEIPLDYYNLVSKKYSNYRSDSDDSWEPRIHDFNFDSKYLIEVNGSPWSTTKEEVVQFFKNITILNDVNGVHFILDEKNYRDGRAFVQLGSCNDLMMAFKLNKQMMGQRYIEGNQNLFNHLARKRLIPSKQRVVFMEGLPTDFTEQDIRSFFSGLPIDAVQFVQNKTKAYVKFGMSSDVEAAIAKNHGDSTINIYRSTEEQMNTSREKIGGRLLPISRASLQRKATKPKCVEPQSESNQKKTTQLDDNQKKTKYINVRNLPSGANEVFVMSLFPGFCLDKNEIQMGRDQKGHLTGDAFVAFNNREDFEFALNTDLSDIGLKFIKVSRATRAQFIMAKEENEANPNI